MKDFFKKLLRFFKSAAKKKAIEVINGMDKLEEPIAAMIDKNIDEKVIAKRIIDFIQKKLLEVIEKIF